MKMVYLGDYTDLHSIYHQDYVSKWTCPKTVNRIPPRSFLPFFTNVAVLGPLLRQSRTNGLIFGINWRQLVYYLYLSFEGKEGEWMVDSRIGSLFSNEAC